MGPQQANCEEVATRGRVTETTHPPARLLLGIPNALMILKSLPVLLSYPRHRLLVMGLYLGGVGWSAGRLRTRVREGWRTSVLLLTALFLGFPHLTKPRGTLEAIAKFYCTVIWQGIQRFLLLRQTLSEVYVAAQDASSMACVFDYSRHCYNVNDQPKPSSLSFRGTFQEMHRVQLLQERKAKRVTIQSSRHW